jgi:predicted secreted Zn-dependent protease
LTVTDLVVSASIDRLWFHFGLMLIALLVGALPTQAAVGITERLERYAISGSTPSDLRREMNSKGFRDNGGQIFDGYTRWDITWRYRYNNFGNACAIVSVATRVTVTITLPKWDGEITADNDTRSQWSRYLAALELHERGHRQLAIDAAKEIDRVISGMNGKCSTLEARANGAGDAILNRYRQLQLDYDRDTNHDATQGARFP